MLMPVTPAGNRAFNRDPPANPATRAAAAMRRHRGDALRSPALAPKTADACLPVRRAEMGSPWLLEESQGGSQRAQALSYVRQCGASVVPGEGHTGRRRATSGGWVELIWEQEAAGSNPAIPTAIFRMFCPSCVSHPGRRHCCVALPDVARDRSVTAHVGSHCRSEDYAEAAAWHAP
jgi:hypothetical protein